MNYNKSSTPRTTLSRHRHQQKPYNVAPLNSVDGDDTSTFESSVVANSNRSDQQEHQYQSDLFEPLTYEEADEDQLAEFFMTLDIDIAFGECDNVINNFPKDSGDTERHSTKRRRLSNSGDSYSSSVSHEADDYDDAGLQRKHRTDSK